MKRTFQVTSRLVALATVTAVVMGVVAGCDSGAKPMSAESQAKYKAMMQDGNAAKGPGQLKGGGGGGGNGP